MITPTPDLLSHVVVAEPLRVFSFDDSSVFESRVHEEAALLQQLRLSVF